MRDRWMPPEDRPDGYQCFMDAGGDFGLVTWREPYWQVSLRQFLADAGDCLFAPMPKEHPHA